MELLCIAGLVAIPARTIFWAVLMYLCLLYACRRIEYPIFSGIVPWTVATIVVCALRIFLPETQIIVLGLSSVQAVLYFYIWYQCILGIRQMEGVYGNLGAHGLWRTYWVELGCAAVSVYMVAVPLSDGLAQVVSIMIAWVQGWKSYLLYRAYRDYVTRRKQLSRISDKI